jgi:hypothetical protein
MSERGFRPFIISLSLLEEGGYKNKKSIFKGALDVVDILS